MTRMLVCLLQAPCGSDVTLRLSWSDTSLDLGMASDDGDGCIISQTNSDVPGCGTWRESADTKTEEITIAAAKPRTYRISLSVNNDQTFSGDLKLEVVAGGATDVIVLGNPLPDSSWTAAFAENRICSGAWSLSAVQVLLPVLLAAVWLLLVA
jgi:hypothetical protein